MNKRYSNKNKFNKVILIILDGWGIGDKSSSDAISTGETPFLDYLSQRYPNSRLLACGENVGLPDGQMGNSEVGHMNIGAGRIVYQDLVKISKEVRENTISKNKTIIDAFNYAKKNNKAVHFIGLVSDGGVHSLDTHLYKLCDITNEMKLEKVFIHAVTDGRDCDPKSGAGFIANLENHLKTSNGTIASLIGRYYTMDRDKRWERVKKGYDLMVKGNGKPSQNILQSVYDSYKIGITDEFIEPVVRVDESGKPVGLITDNDVVFCFNFRTDRLREITQVLTCLEMPEEEMKTLPLYYLTMTNYDDSFRHVKVVYSKDNLTETIGEILSELGLKQLRIAETEKYPHVTFFFSGGREKPFDHEERILVYSPKVATYDLKPEMSAYEVKDKVVEALKTNKFDFICLNFANGDMVGHTGIYEAILKAVKTIDSSVQNVVETAIGNNYIPLIIADHGNADYAINQEDGTPNTAHSLNPVPCILVSDKYSKINDGVLADVAPTILSIMGVTIPDEMTGKILIE